MIVLTIMLIIKILVIIERAVGINHIIADSNKTANSAKTSRKKCTAFVRKKRKWIIKNENSKEQLSVFSKKNDSPSKIFQKSCTENILQRP